MCGRAKKMALSDELKWLERVNEWRARCEELEKEHRVIPERQANNIKLPVRVHIYYLYVVPKVKPWELTFNMQWELCWDNQVYQALTTKRRLSAPPDIFFLTPDSWRIYKCQLGPKGDFL
jgi:hypothetical protein